MPVVCAVRNMAEYLGSDMNYIIFMRMALN